MRKNRKAIKHLITTLVITALILTGSAPYFAFGVESDEEMEANIIPSATYDDSRVPPVNGYGVVLMNAKNGDILYEKNSHVVVEPASVTKILTFLVALDHLELDQEIKVPKDVETAGTSIDLVPGEKLTVEQLYYGMMLESGNDAAQLLGQKCAGGDLDKFAKMMNKKAVECGALDSDFKNPNGLNEYKGKLNTTSAYDLAVITREGLKNETFRKVVSTVHYTIPKTNKSKQRKLKNSNSCLWNMKTDAFVDGKYVPFKYDGCIGVKTGYTSSAGNCYVGAAKRGNLELIVVSMKSSDMAAKYSDAISLWNYGFEHYRNYTAMKQEDSFLKQKVKRGSLAKVEVSLTEDFNITVDKGYKAAKNITTEIKLKDEKPVAPIKKGQVMGSVVAYNEDGAIIAQKDLIALEEVEKGGPLSYIGIADEYAWIPIAIVVLLLAAFIFLIARKKIRRIQRRKAHSNTSSTEGIGQSRPPETRVQETRTPEAGYPETRPPERSYIIPKLDKSNDKRAEPLANLNLSKSVRTDAGNRSTSEDYRRSTSAANRTTTADRTSGASERPARTRRQKRAARKQRARRRKERQRNNKNE